MSRIKFNIENTDWEPIKGPCEDDKIILDELAKRSPYGVKVLYKTDNEFYKVRDVSPNIDLITILAQDVTSATGYQFFGTHTEVKNVMPCLRSLYTITEDEINELVGHNGMQMSVQFDYEGKVIDIIAPWGIENYCKLIDWLYKKQFNTILPRNAYFELPKELYDD